MIPTCVWLERAVKTTFMKNGGTMVLGDNKVMSLLSSLTWWLHPIRTFSALLAICAGNSPVNGEFTGQRGIPRTKASVAELWCFLCSAPDKRLCKQSWGWWFGMPSHPLWRHCNENMQLPTKTGAREAGYWLREFLIFREGEIVFTSPPMFWIGCCNR